MPKAKHPLICGVVLAAPLVFAPCNGAQAFSLYTIEPGPVDAPQSFVSLEVTRDETTLSGNWTGQAADPLQLLPIPIPGYDPVYAENGTYTVKLEEKSTTSTSQLSGGLIATKTSDNLAFGFSGINLSQPDNLAGELSIFDSIGAVEVAGSSAAQQQLDYPSKLPIFFGGFSPFESNLRDAINGNLGEVFNYGFFYDLPLNGQAPVGNYDATPGSNSISINLNGKNVGLGPTSISTNIDGTKTALSFFELDDLQKEYLIGGTLEFTDFAANGLAPYGISLQTLANPATVSSDWIGAYVAGKDEDIIVLRFDYQYSLTSTINEFFDSQQCLETDFGEACKDGISNIYEQWDISSPTGTITTNFRFTGQIAAYGVGTYCDNFDCSEVAPVPLPAALPLLMSALGMFGFFGWRRKRMAAA